MSSSIVEQRVGAQRPRLQLLPPGQVSSAGQDAVDFAAACGLILDDWQQWCLDKMLGEDATGKALASTVLLIIPRQNGKNAVLEALELYAFYVLDEPRILHSAHLQKTSADHMLRMVSLIRANPELDAITHPYFANGKEALQRKDTGARLEFITRGRKTARGGSPTRVVFDEALFLADEQVQSMLPSMSAQSMRSDPPQLIYTSSAPLPESATLHRLRRLGIDGGSDRLFYAEWGAELGVDIRDRDVWYRTNPGLGIRISEDWVADVELAQMSAEAFAVERLGVVFSDDGLVGHLPGWDLCRADRSRLDQTPSVVALSVSTAGQWAAVVAAGMSADGVPYVELMRREPGTAWVVDEVVRATSRLGCLLVVDPKSPTAALLDSLARAGVATRQITTAEYVRACGAIQVDVANRAVRHFGDQPLDASVVGADIRPVGDAWVWSQRASTVDVSPLMAATLALGVLRQPEPPVDVHTQPFIDLDDF